MLKFSLQDCPTPSGSKNLAFIFSWIEVFLFFVLKRSSSVKICLKVHESRSARESLHHEIYMSFSYNLCVGINVKEYSPRSYIGL